jgi:hypothetical protein
VGVLAVRAAKVDANQRQVVEGLQKFGASVAVLSTVGHGIPDVVVGFRGKNFLLELKDGDKVPSARKLTPAQEMWHAAWKGHTAVVHSLEEAIREITK